MLICVFNFLFYVLNIIYFFIKKIITFKMVQSEEIHPKNFQFSVRVSRWSLTLFHSFLCCAFKECDKLNALNLNGCKFF